MRSDASSRPSPGAHRLPSLSAKCGAQSSPADGGAGEGDERVAAVTGSSDGTVRVWDLAAGEQLGGPLTGHTAAVCSVVATSATGQLLAMTAGDELPAAEIVGRALPVLLGGLPSRTMLRRRRSPAFRQTEATQRSTAVSRSAPSAVRSGRLSV
ncbi:hypothetical protein ACIBQ1_56760 [Nonomuraea sp. NPDC050153]|uniref:hypothetical protein n=1 Tax=Nonomuraea sp. NPDC050153 TaxID=3364359 RepID=UPI0037B8AB58